MRASGDVRKNMVRDALSVVMDPELDQPITDLDFVQSVTVSEGADVVVHLRLPTSFCAPNFAYLMASDSKDVVVQLPWTRAVTVELDDHHDSQIINAGLAANAGYRGTFAHEAEDDLEELRTTFLRKAHVAAMERCLTAMMKRDRTRRMQDMGTVLLKELPDDDTTAALISRRASIGLPATPDSLVMVDHTGAPYAEIDVPLALRRARSTRISIDGNAHFCRGLLRTRYDDPNRTTVSA